ncbi:MAG: M23 family metallopeptidase [Bacteroidia bacterium]|nr:M23 family metallopeptidase [Bacteroidia bacterium]
MPKERKRDKIKKLFQNPYRIVIFNDLNLHIIRQVRFNARTLVMAIVFAVIFIIVGVTVLIAFTPLREYIPGYPTGKMRQILIRNVLVVDSLELEIQRRDRYFNDFRAMLAGETPTDTAVRRGTIPQPDQVQFKKYDHDSLFKDEIAQEQTNLGINSGSGARGGVAGLLFFPPLNGMVTGKHDVSNGHFGVDIVGKLNSRISAALDGTVIFAGWTIDTGYVIYIQHEQNLITVYRHNAELLKIQGDKVRAGEAIAIMGNSGKETTGPHLHFEMWLNGVSINPEDYIKF